MDTACTDIRDALFDEVYALASKDKGIIFMTADTDALSLRRYKKDFPERFINIGVAEQNMVTVAAGLALSEKRVFIYSIIPFITLRCYEHIKVNICSMNLPITIIGVGAGLSFSNDGPTHHGVCDIAVMRTLPEMAIFNPSDPITASASAQIAYGLNSPAYIRLDKGRIPALYNRGADFSSGLSVFGSGSDICIIATGTMVHRALEVADELVKNNIGAKAIDLYRLKPVNKELFIDILKGCKRIVTLEENNITGGIGSIVSEILTDDQIEIPLKRIAVKDEQSFRYGTRDWLHKLYKIDRESILEEILKWHNNAAPRPV